MAEKFQRYAMFYAPPAGSALAAFGAGWLGWDAEAGANVRQPKVPGIADLTRAPQKYGFHGTLKPPFRLAEGESPAKLQADLAAWAAERALVGTGPLQLARLGRFLALIPSGDRTGLANLAFDLVRDFDRYRAPADEAELARRRARGLIARQEDQLIRWGYPYVGPEFRFHLTLTGALEAEQADLAEATLIPRIAPFVRDAFLISELCLFGERGDGRFHIISRHSLSG